MKLEQQQLLYLIFCFLIVPLKKEYFEEYFERFKSFKTEDIEFFKTEDIEFFFKLCKLNETSIQDFFTCKKLYDQGEFFEVRCEYIKAFAKKLNYCNNSYNNYKYINLFHKNVFDLFKDVNYKYKFVMFFNNNLNKYCEEYIFKDFQHQEENIITHLGQPVSASALSFQHQLDNIVKDIYLSLQNQETYVTFQLYNEKLFKDQKKLQDNLEEFSQKLSKNQEKLDYLNKKFDQTKMEIKRSKPVFQLSLFGTLFTLLIGAMEILYTSNISFKMLTDSKNIVVSIFLLFMVFVATLYFIYILQKIFFRSMDGSPKALSFSEDFLIGFIIALILLVIMIASTIFLKVKL